MYEYNIQNKTEPLVLVKPRIALKDLRDHFYTGPKVRLICPSKWDVGNLSKIILDKYIPKLNDRITLNSWSDSNEALEWFNSIVDKQNYKFIQIDIDNYYASINSTVIDSTLIYAKNRTPFSMN